MSCSQSLISVSQFGVVLLHWVLSVVLNGGVPLEACRKLVWSANFSDDLRIRNVSFEPDGLLRSVR